MNFFGVKFLDGKCVKCNESKSNDDIVLVCKNCYEKLKSKESKSDEKSKGDFTNVILIVFLVGILLTVLSPKIKKVDETTIPESPTALVDIYKSGLELLKNKDYNNAYIKFNSILSSNADNNLKEMCKKSLNELLTTHDMLLEKLKQNLQAEPSVEKRIEMRNNFLNTFNFSQMKQELERQNIEDMAKKYDSEWAYFSCEKLKVTIKYPANWKRIPNGNSATDYNNGFFSISALKHSNIDIFVDTLKEQFMFLYGTNPEIKKDAVQGNAVRIIKPCSDAIKPTATAVVKYPISISPDTLLLVHSDQEHIDYIAKLVKFN